jgi:putative SOS response-associated peptidase YedK
MALIIVLVTSVQRSLCRYFNDAPGIIRHFYIHTSTFNARRNGRNPSGKRSRCLISTSGYDEWESTPRGKRTHYFTRADGPM